MIALDPSPWLLLTIPMVGVMAFITQRGWVRNEFRVPGRSGWATYATGTFNWCLASVVNFAFLAASLVAFYSSLVHGTDFAREPEHSMPALSGKLIKNVKVQRSPASLAACLANLDSGQAYEMNPDHWRVAVRNGRGSVMAIFEIAPDAAGSRLEVYQRWTIAFVTWERCYNPSDDGGFSSPYLSSQV